MLKVGDIYYLCDQYGPKFVKIITIGDLWTKDDNWVFFYKSTYLKNVVTASTEKYYGCDKAQVKKWHFEKLIDKLTYAGNFKGCIKISDEVIQSINNGKESDVISLIASDPNIYPYMQIVDMLQHIPDLPEKDHFHKSYLESVSKISCKRISKEDFRNLKLNKILE